MNLTADSEDVEDPDSKAEDRVDVTRDNQGATRITFPGHDHVETKVDVYLPDDEDATITVAGFNYDDEEPAIQVKLFSNHADFSMDLTPGQARGLAADLDYAARAAEDPAEVADE
jgi:hypothetical protein